MQRHSAFAREGIGAFVVCAIIAIALAKWFGPLWALPMLIPIGLLIALFQDPVRESPLRPLAALAPCDGKVISVGLCRAGLLDRESLRVIIRVNPWGAYTLRAPVEGKIFDPRDNDSEGSKMTGRGGLWLRTDEGDDVVVAFSGGHFFSVPMSFRRYGERVGHGHRCGFLRLAVRCEVYLPANALPRVEEGDRVLAAVDVLADLVRERASKEVEGEEVADSASDASSETA
ncbi:MAG: hypothetical protein AB8F65_03195 [Woeseiaceae bacterium]